MLNSRKGEPKVIALPKTLLIYDLLALEAKMKGFNWNKCPGISTISVVKKTPIITEPEEIEEDIQIEEEVAPVLVKKVTKHDEVEDSTPSMQSLPPIHELFAAQKSQIIRTAPPDAFKSLNIEIIHEEPLVTHSKSKDTEVIENPVSDRKSKIEIKEISQRSKAIQCAALFVTSVYVQTEIFQNTSKLIQTDSENFASKSIQTDPEKQRMKIRSRLESTVQIMDQETITDLNIDEVYDGYTLLKTKCEELSVYKQTEDQRVKKINNSWANQFRELRDENATLKEKIKQLEEELKELKTKDDGVIIHTLSNVYSHAKLKEDLATKFFIQDENILRKCDPNYYLGFDQGYSTFRSSHETMNFKEEYQGKFTDAIKTFGEFK